MVARPVQINNTKDSDSAGKNKYIIFRDKATNISIILNLCARSIYY